MTPEQFLAQIARAQPQPAYLFLGPEPYRRAQCRGALAERVLGAAGHEDGLIRHDLDETTLGAVIDDACSLSLFAANRLLWVGRAEAVLPRGRAVAAADDEDSDGKASKGDSGPLEVYVKNPVPGVVLVFDSSRFEFEGEDKAKSERVRKFYSSVPGVVEFPRYSPAEMRRLAQDLARDNRLQIGADEIQLLVEATGNSAAALATEMEKLALFAGSGRRVTADDIAQMTPQAGTATIFSLVAALGRHDRAGALSALDALTRAGEYLPLALAFLATQFRQALVAGEAGLRSAGQIQGHFSRLGVPMWPSRAEQIAQTVAAFPPKQLRAAMIRMAAADKGLRDIRPDDRIVMEEFVLALTK